MKTATSDPLRLTLLGPIWPYRGGIAHFSQSLAKEMQLRGHQVNAVTFARQYPERLFPGKTQFAEGEAPEGQMAPRLLDSINLFTWRKTADAIIEQKPDVVLIPYWMSFFAPSLGFVARRLRKAGVRVIGIVHNALPHERRVGDRALGKYFLNACDGLIVMSDKVRRDVESLAASTPLQQVAHPVYDVFGEAIPKNQARQELNLETVAQTMLFFGFIRQYKGLHVLLDAMPAVLAKLPNAKLVVAGEFYSDEVALREKATTSGDAVRFDADYIPDVQVGRYFCAADVVVQPYLTATQSGVAQIAFHFGRPVITTDVGGLAEIVPDGQAGLVVPPDNSDALADAIIRFFEEQMEEDLTKGVLVEREKYSWPPMCQAVEDLSRVSSD